MNGEELFWIIVATIVAGILKWAENRWPARPPRGRRYHHDDADEAE